MKKILLMVPSLGMGGMERVCINYANLLTRHGYRVYIYNLTSDDPMIVGNLDPNVIYKKNIIGRVPNVRSAGLKNILRGNFRLLPWELWLKKTNPKKVYRKLVGADNISFDIEVAFYGGHIMRILTGSSLKKSLKIGWIHASTIESHFSLFKSFEEAKKTYRSMDTLVCVSKLIEERAKEYFGDDIQTKVIYNPNDAKRIRSLAKAPIIDVKKEKFTFINASRIDIEHKGYDRLVTATKRLESDGFQFDIWLLGNGKDEEELKQLISAAGVKSIHLLGEKENPYAYMSLADCYICSSRFEGFSMVVAEAIILGVPVISTDISGAREMLGDSEYGLVVENTDDGIYEGMKKVLSSEEVRRWQQEKAGVRKDFLSEKAIIERFEEIVAQYGRME